MNTFVSGWYVVYTRPRHEKKVAEGLINAGIEYYLPTIKSLRIWHDRRKYLDMPLFQSYVFVYLTSLKAYYDVLRVNGALKYVRFGKEIARLADTAIEEIKLLLGSASAIEVSATHFPPGHKFYIQEGPLAGVSCELVEVNNKEKVLVRMHLLQQNLLVELPAEHLMTAPV